MSVPLKKNVSLSKNTVFIAGIFMCTQETVEGKKVTQCRSTEGNLWGICDYVIIDQSNNELMRCDIDPDQLLNLIEYFPNKINTFFYMY